MQQLKLVIMQSAGDFVQSTGVLLLAHSGIWVRDILQLTGT